MTIEYDIIAIVCPSAEMANSANVIFERTRLESVIEGAYYYKELEALEVEWKAFVVVMGDIEASDDEIEKAKQLFALKEERRKLLNDMISLSLKRALQAKDWGGVAI